MNLKERYGNKYKVALCDKGEGGCYEIAGKHGYIRLYGADLELYLSRSVIERRIERSFPAFKAKNHYDDATTFVFANSPELVVLAAKWIKARNRKQYTPEQRLAMASRMRSLHEIPRQRGTLAGISTKTGGIRSEASER